MYNDDRSGAAFRSGDGRQSRRRFVILKVKRYKLLLLLSIALNLVVGAIIFASPDAFTRFAGQPDAFPKAWPRHWGMQLWAINFLYLPGYWDPQHHRWPNWCGIVIRLAFSAFFFSQGDGFTPMAIYDGAWGLTLLAAYVPVLRSAPKHD